MGLLPASYRQHGHRVLGKAEGLPTITGFELALSYGDNAPAAAAVLAERLTAFCKLEP